jgi:hypothetical protein
MGIQARQIARQGARIDGDFRQKEGTKRGDILSSAFCFHRHLRINLHI